jgi:hypothetical protein
MEEAGGPLVYGKRYAEYSNPFNPRDPGYASNKYEVEARYFGWGYGNGLDLYGRGNYSAAAFRNKHRRMYYNGMRSDPGAGWLPFTEVY